MKSIVKLKERMQKLKDEVYILKLQLSEVNTRNRQLQRINAKQGDVIIRAIASMRILKKMCKERVL